MSTVNFIADNTQGKKSFPRLKWLWTTEQMEKKKKTKKSNYKHQDIFLGSPFRNEKIIIILLASLISEAG